MRKIVRDLLKAYEEKGLTRFEKFIKAYYNKAYRNIDKENDDVVMKLLMRILKEDNYKYLKVVKEKKSNFEFFVMMTEMEEIFDEKFGILKESVGKSFSKFDYDIESNLRGSILIALVSEHDQLLSISEQLPRHIDNKFGIMPYDVLQEKLEVIFWQFDLMLDLIKDEQRHSKAIGSKRGNPLFQRTGKKARESQKNYTKLSELWQVAYDELASFDIAEKKLCEIIKMDLTKTKSFNKWKNNNLEFFLNLGKNISPEKRKELVNQILKFLKISKSDFNLLSE